MSERSIRVIGRLETESWRDETRSLNDGASYIVKANSLEIRDADGSAREIIHLDSLRDLNRDETRVAFRPQGDRLVNLNAASLDDASHLEQRLRTVLSGSQDREGGGSLADRLGIVGALLVLVLVGALLVLVLAGGGSSRTEDVHVPLEQGASAAVTAGTHGQHKIMVNQVIDNATSTIQSQPRAGNRLWAIEVAVENPSAREIVVGEWRLRTYDGAEYESEFVSGVTPQLNAVQNLIPGTKTQGIVLFQVPSDAEVRSLRYEPNVVSKGDLYFDAVR